MERSARFSFSRCVSSSFPLFLFLKFSDLIFIVGGRGLRGIDVNRAPAAERESEEEEAGVSSPNSTVSSVSGKRGCSERDVQNGEDNEMERASSRGISDEEDGDGSRKKLRLSKDQSAILEESFKEHNTLNPVSVHIIYIY